MANGIVWYGERGIVNALVADLSAHGAADAALRVRALLKAVQWADDGPQHWIDDITRVRFLVELGAGRLFGSPDLILDCECGTGRRHAVLIEAKVVPYLGSAMSNTTGMVPGYNSSINGQLALRYRLSHALSGTAGQPSVIEPAELWQAYQQPPATGGLGDLSLGPRHLDNTTVLHILESIRGLPLEHYHLVAWTWDREPFFHSSAGAAEEYWPRFLTPDGGDAWEVIRARVGWLGFEAVETNIHPGHTYHVAVATMLPTLAPAATVNAAPPAPPLSPTNVSSFSAATLARVNRLADLAVELVGASLIPPTAGHAVGIKLGNVQGKVTPWWEGTEERVLVGIRSTLSPQDWWPTREGDLGLRRTGGGGGLGVFYYIRTPDDLVEAERIASEVFQMIADRVGD